jgi:hypothetical protein
MGRVEVAALRDQRLTTVEDAAREYYRAMVAADEASTALTEALMSADALNQDNPRTVSDQMLADWVNHGIPEGAQAFRKPLRMSLMAVRRRIGKADDQRRHRDRRR